MSVFKLMSYTDNAKQLNNRIFTDYFYRLMLISKTLFKWENLPNGINEKWIERFLFTEGSCLFYKDPKLGYMVAKLGETGTINTYDEPTKVQPYATNYIYEGEQLINNDNCVIIRNNDDCVPTALTIQLYAMKLTNIDRTIDVNIEAQKTPIIIKCSDKQKMTLKHLFNQRKDNEPLIYGDKNLDLEGISVLKTDAPIVFDKLQLQKHQIYNECMTFLGVNNANLDKKERLITNEVDANNDQINVNEDVMLKAREDACKLINKMFGLDIKVSRRQLDTNDMSDMDDTEIREVE